MYDKKQTRYSLIDSQRVNAAIRKRHVLLFAQLDVALIITSALLYLAASEVHARAYTRGFSDEPYATSHANSLTRAMRIFDATLLHRREHKSVIRVARLPDTASMSPN